jgi:putative protease
MDKIKSLIDKAKSMGAEHILIGNLGHLALARESGMRIHGDFRLNISNNYSAGYIEELGFEDMILSPELTLPRLRDIKGKSSAVVYGRLPLMITEKCIGKEIGDCDACKAGKLTLVDRKGISFPVLQSFGHRSIIVNSLPHYMADRSKELDLSGITMRHFIFTVESKAEAAKVIDAYKRSLPPANNQAVKRIK